LWQSAGKWANWEKAKTARCKAYQGMISDSLGPDRSIRHFNGEVRESMIPSKLPKYVVLIRGGTFRVDIVGRPQIIAATVASSLGWPEGLCLLNDGAIG
jgi:hypothetical protein